MGQTWKNNFGSKYWVLRLGRLGVLLFLTFGALDSSAQEVKVENRLAEIMKATREQQKPVPDGRELFLDEQDYPLLEPYFNDTDVYVRRQAYIIAHDIAFATTSTLIQQNFVERTLEQAFDFENVDSRIRNLCKFAKNLFSSKAKALLGQQLKRAEEEWALSQGGDALREKEVRRCFNHLILCVAAAEDREKLDLLEEIKKKYGGVFEDLGKKYSVKKKRYHQNLENPWFDQPAWYALIARAKMGVKEDIAFCIKLVDEFPDVEMKCETIYRELAEIPQPEVLEYFYKSLDSKESYVDSSSDTKIELSTVSLFYLIQSIDDSVLSKIKISNASDAVSQMREYVKTKAGGDPKKLPIRSLLAEDFKKSQKSARQQVARNKKAQMAPSK